MSNIETVQHMYAAFGEGDIPAILEHLDDDIQWEYGGTSTDVPWLQPLHGKTEVPKFFENLAAVEFHEFKPGMFFESGDVVVVLLDVEFTVKATDERVSEKDEVHIWHFTPKGRVSGFAHKVDTHRAWQAYHGRDD